ncbi:MAG: YbhB/YbcL family Raf kinase inhibitor-like protein [bacterium]|nr:YbhB/YbcL family Raf kinase inhibitor-like protein [bacterium]
MQRILLIAATVLLLGGGCVQQTPTTGGDLEGDILVVPEEPSFVCAQDAKECPDGSFVSRTAPPSCAFAACPEVAASAPTPAPQPVTTPEPTREVAPRAPAPFAVSSPAFAYGTPIPMAYSCQGSNTNPPLAVSGVPEGTKSFALTFVDTDGQVGGFTHWVLWNIPATATTIATGSVPSGAVQGAIEDGERRYFGPCPPPGTHHYVFTLYALDTVLDLPGTTNRAGLASAMRGHTLKEAQTMGTYTYVE